MPRSGRRGGGVFTREKRRYFAAGAEPPYSIYTHSRHQPPRMSAAPFARFSHAIVCPPAANFADGLTTVSLGAPDVPRALRQHAAYCDALRRHGCALIELPADEAHPDSTFVEDTALILPGRGAIMTRPGALSRLGEVQRMREVVLRYFLGTPTIQAPGTLDAGDVCEVGAHCLIGISHRTNAAGAHQLAEWLRHHGVSSSTIDIRETPGILHLKSGVTALDEQTLLAIPALASHAALADYEVLTVPAHEAYAANCVRVNDVVFIANGFPETAALLASRGYALEPLDMSEFEKMDGGLTCLSLRF